MFTFLGFHLRLFKRNRWNVFAMLTGFEKSKDFVCVLMMEFLFILHFILSS